MSIINLFFLFPFNFLIFYIFFSFIKTQKIREIPKWEDSTKTIQDPSGFGSSSSFLINSVSYDNVTNNILYFGQENGKKYLYLKGKTKISGDIVNELSYISSPLVYSNNQYYFCSSSSRLIKIRENGSIQKVRNPFFLDGKKENWNLKYYYAQSLGKLIVAFIGEQYLYVYDLSSDNWNENSVYGFGEGTTILGFNYIYESGQFIFCFCLYNKSFGRYALGTGGYDNNYFFNDFYYFLQEKNLEEIQLYSKNEISFATSTFIILFTYEPNSEKYRFFHVNKYDYQIVVYGSNTYTRFFRDYIFIQAKFFENTPLLYYSLKSMRFDNYYVGVVDLQYFILLYNIEVDKAVNNLNFYYGYLYKSKGFLSYFENNGDEKLICPFISKKNYDGEDDCQFFTYLAKGAFY